MSSLSRILFTLAILTLGASSQVAAETFVVEQIGTTFQPDLLTISVGDTVQWTWSFGVHTVTSGDGALDPEAGLLFDEPLTSANSLVEFVFNESGDVPYFCRPHEIVGMVGMIQVEADTAVPPPVARTLALESYPNPFNPSTTLTFTLSKAQAIELAIYDSRGRRVRTLLSGQRESGVNAVVWDGRDDEGRALVSGIYLARATGAAALGSDKLVLLK